jgi:hypothetical protein
VKDYNMQPPGFPPEWAMSSGCDLVAADIFIYENRLNTWGHMVMADREAAISISSKFREIAIGDNVVAQYVKCRVERAIKFGWDMLPNEIY